MKYLPGSGNVVAIAFEVLRERDDILEHRRPTLVIVVNSRGGRTLSGEEGCPGWIAEWGCAVGVGKQSPAFCEPVDVWSGDAGVTFQAADPIVHVVHGDEKDVWARCGSGAGQRGSK